MEGLRTQDAASLRAALAARRALVDETARRSLPVKLRLGLARALHLASRLSGRAIKVRASTFWEDQMEVIFPEVVSEFIFRAGYYELGLTTMLIDRLRPGDVFLDVGAHFGYFSLLASLIVGQAGQVHAFEPTPRTFAILNGNVAGRRNVSTVNQAVYSTPTTLQFNDFGTQYSAYNSLFGPRLREQEKSGLTPTVRSVVATTIDDYLRSHNLRANFIKIDAEDAELDVLRGAEQTLAAQQVALTIEVGDDSTVGTTRRSRTVVDHLIARGYLPFEFRAGEVVRHEPRDRYAYDNLLFLPSKSTDDQGTSS